MNRTDDKKNRIRFVEFIVLSLAIHFLIIYMFIGDLFIVRTLPIITGKPVDVYVVGPEMERQIVSIDNQAGDKEANPNARFLSGVNKKVNNETRARLWGRPFNKKMQIVQGILKEDLDNVIGSYMHKRNNKPRNENDSDKNYSETKDSSTYDYLPDVKEGEITSLNTAEFVYYSFYSRVEDSIVSLWNRYVNDYIMSHPDVRANLGKRDYITEVEAVLDEKGNFMRMNIIRSSGVTGIDLAPGKAFSEASPFENPPKGMIDPDNTIKMKWRFIVSIVEQVRGSMQQMDYYNSYRQGYPDPALQRQIY
ncbi:MAG: hypothetical protein NTY22_01440 [Proteobacteria bacterium]|nr:hypothetical protein [Pseudomonadota bacterium]